jgi:predicted nuclease with TOPRIM domain
LSEELVHPVSAPEIKDRVENQLLTALAGLREENRSLEATREELVDRIAQLSRENAELLFDHRELEVEAMKVTARAKRYRKVRPPIHPG